MIKKTVALATSVCFFIFSFSCAFHTWERVKLESIKPKERISVKISSIQLLSGERIDFSKRPPAQIAGEKIVSKKAAMIT